MTTTLYKGAGPGTHWHNTDPASCGGFKAPGGSLGANAASHSTVVTHIAVRNSLGQWTLSAQSPLLSFSMSFAIAREYALSGPGGLASKTQPGVVYEIDLSAVQGWTPSVVNPVAHLCSFNGTGAHAHQHDGCSTLIYQIAKGMSSYTAAPRSGGSSLAPIVSQDLIALVNAIRDAEVLIADQVPAAAIVRRYMVW